MSDSQYALIIPAWNEAAFIESCIASAQAAMNSVPFSGQLIVVDNNSTDDTAQLANNAGASVVFEPVNQIARARNAGASAARAANASMLVFIDADTHINASVLLTALEALQSNQVVGGGANIRGDRVTGTTVRLTIKFWNWSSRKFKLAAGCFVFARADAFESVGGFEQQRYAGEELALSRSLRRWGKAHDMQFHIISEHTVETSLRKLDWYTQTQLFKQFLVAILPGALGSKRLMHLWYDDDVDRTKGNVRSPERPPSRPEDSSVSKE